LLASAVNSLTLGLEHMLFPSMGASLFQNVGGQLGVKPGSHRVDAEVTFHIFRFPILFLDVF